MVVARFALEHLPPPPCRVLEVGCGDGELARALALNGYDVVAIDPRAPGGDLFRAVALEEFADPEPFDAVVAARSLHHIGDLDGAVAKIAALLRPGGRLVIHEHAWERFDDATDRWYRAHGGHAHDWADYHRDLHTSEAMLAALAERFTQRHFAWSPYLYRELAPAVSREEEQAQIDAGAIAATGFDYAGDSVAPHGDRHPA